MLLPGLLQSSYCLHAFPNIVAALFLLLVVAVISVWSQSLSVHICMVYIYKINKRPGRDTVSTILHQHIIYEEAGTGRL